MTCSDRWLLCGIEEILRYNGSIYTRNREVFLLVVVSWMLIGRQISVIAPRSEFLTWPPLRGSAEDFHVNVPVTASATSAATVTLSFDGTDESEQRT